MMSTRREQVAAARARTGPRPERVRDWPYAVVIAAPLLLFAPFLLGLRVLYWGTPLLQFYPWRLAALAAVQSGEWPLWDPWVGNGAPLLANYQTGVLYPPNWLVLLLPLDLSMGWLAALHLALAGAGMVTLARALGLRPLGQVVAGLAFGLSQYLVARASFLSLNAAVAWLPWVVWAVERQTQLPAAATARQRLRPALVLAAVVGLLLLAGHAQTAWYSLLIAGAWALWRLLGSRGAAGTSAWRGRIAIAAWLLAPILLGAGLAAAQLLPTAELMHESPRAVSADYRFVMTYSFSPWRLLTLLVPDLLGNPARGRFYGYGNYWEDAIYAGVLPLVLAGTTLLGTLWQRLRRNGSVAAGPAPVDGLPLFLGLVGLASVLLALGQNTPIFPFFYYQVPTFNLFQAPARIMLGMVFALALLAGLGADRWQAPRGRALYWTRLGTAGALAVAVVGLAALVALPATGRLVAQLRVAASAVGLSGLGLLAAGVLSLLKDRLPTRWWTLAVVAVLLLDLLYFGHGLNPGAPRALYSEPSTTAAALAPHLEGHRLFVYPVEEQVIKFKRLLSFETFGPPAKAFETRAALLPNTAGLDGLASANNFDPLVSTRYARLLEAAEATQSPTLLRLMNVAVLGSSTPRNLPVLAEAPSVGMQFYQVPGAIARAWVVHQARVAPGADAALELLVDPAFDPATTVVLEAGEVEAGTGGGRPNVGAVPLALSASANKVTVKVTLAQAGWLVLADTHYPGWVARVDGVSVPVLHANYAFRAVAVEAGTRTVEFVYRPRSFAVGVRLSLGSLLVWLSAAALSRRPPAGTNNAGRNAG